MNEWKSSQLILANIPWPNTHTHIPPSDQLTFTFDLFTNIILPIYLITRFLLLGKRKLIFTGMNNVESKPQIAYYTYRLLVSLFLAGALYSNCSSINWNVTREITRPTKNSLNTTWRTFCKEAIRGQTTYQATHMFLAPFQNVFIFAKLGVILMIKITQWYSVSCCRNLHWVR